jgi:hypothetical protein
MSAFPETINEFPEDFFASLETLDPKHKKKSSAPAPVNGSAKKFEHLLAGDIAAAGFTDESAADQSLCSYLARKGFSREMTELMWKKSLPREKLNRIDYVRMTLDRAYEGIAPPAEIDPETWEELFTPASEYRDEDTTVKELVGGLLIADALHMFTGAPGSRKTLMTLAIAKGFVTRQNVFEHEAFPVNSESPVPVIYLQADMPHKLFIQFCRYFGLLEPEVGNLFRVLTTKKGVSVKLDDPRLQRAARGRVIFADSYFDISGTDDEKEADQHRKVLQDARTLIEVYGALAVIILHHPTKAGGAPDAEITWTSFVRGSSAVFGKLDVCYGVQVQKDGTVLVKNLKPRPFEKAPESFTLAPFDENGLSHISKGTFPVRDAPGEVDENRLRKQKAGSPGDPDRDLKLKHLQDIRRTCPKDGSRVWVKKLEAFGFKIGYRTAQRWLDEADEAENQYQRQKLDAANPGLEF